MTKLTRETISCHRNGHGWIATPEGPRFATRARTCWWFIGSQQLHGDACAGYELVSADGVLVEEPQRLYRSRERAAGAKRFQQELTPCERPDVEYMAACGHIGQWFRQLVCALYGEAA
jgi:hypothetical protein